MECEVPISDVRPAANGWANRSIMRSGKPRPSAIRDFPVFFPPAEETEDKAGDAVSAAMEKSEGQAGVVDHEEDIDNSGPKPQEEEPYSTGSDRSPAVQPESTEDGERRLKSSKPAYNGQPTSSSLEAEEAPNELNSEEQSMKTNAKNSGVRDLPGEATPAGVGELHPMPKPAVVRDLPEKPKSAGIHDLPEKPKSAGIHDLQEKPKRAVVRDLPDKPKSAGIHDIREKPKPAVVRDLPGKPKSAGIHDLQEKPKPAGVHDLPDKPQTTEVHDLADKPKQTVVRDLPESATVTDLPEILNSSSKKVIDKKTLQSKQFAGRGAQVPGTELQTDKSELVKTPAKRTPQSNTRQPSSKRTKPEGDETPKVSKRKSNIPNPDSAKRARRSLEKKGKSAAGGDLMPVHEALRLFDAIRRRLVLEDERNGKSSKRIDLLASMMMKKKIPGQYEKIKGSIPGLEIGDIFFFRSELSYVKVHAPPQGGIEYLTAKESEWNEPVAINIISIVGQDDASDTGEELIYAGQGGRSADNKQVDDQKLERGNLAMDGCRKFNEPVRVIRGIKDANSLSGKLYIYDGLYSVEDSYTVKGSGGFDEYRFKLKRIPQQAPLASRLVMQANNLRKQSPASRKDVAVRDISKGKESQPICVVNTVDTDKGPNAFEYGTGMVFSDDIEIEKSTKGCSCEGICGFSSKCSCFAKNGEDFPYISYGILVKEKNFVFECSRHCMCASSCRNRGLSKAGKFQLEVFKTEERGWGLRTLETIPAGSFVCEYVGKVIADQDGMEAACGKEYALDVRRLFNEPPRWGDTSIIFPDSVSATDEMTKLQIVIDATEYGNVARFVNHSCSPNLLVQKVLWDHGDERFPRLKLFAMDHIHPMGELTFDYGLPLSESHAKDCLCGSSNCRGQM